MAQLDRYTFSFDRLWEEHSLGSVVRFGVGRIVSRSTFFRNSRIAWQVIDREAVLVNLATGKTLGMNEAGGWIWSNLDEYSAEEISASLASRFSLTLEDARRDVDEFIGMLCAEGLATQGARE